MSEQWFESSNRPDWRITRLKRLAALRSEKVERTESSLRYIGLEHVVSWTGRLTEAGDDALEALTGNAEESGGTANAFYKGDVLLGKLRPYLAKAYLAQEAGCCSPELLVLTPGPHISSHYLLYALLVPNFIGLINSAAFGTKMPRADWDIIGNVLMPAPPLAAQEIIVAFLDRETARLDRLAAARQRQFALLAAKRRALIAQAVTRGLAAQVPRRASGVPGLGEVPAHWELIRLRFLAEVRGGITKGKDYGKATTVTVPYLRVANVQAEYINLTDVAEIEVLPGEVENYALLPGDVLMNEGGDADKLGRGAVWRGEIAPCLHQNHVFAVRCFGVEPDWLATVSNSDYSKGYFESRARQSTNLASISSANIKEFTVIMPPPAERQAILAYLESELGQIEVLRKAIERSLALLRKKRASLITAAVTGQLVLSRTAHVPA